MRTSTRVVVGSLLFALPSVPAAALDCDRVKALQAEGKRPSEIAQALAITTPDVQACLAGAVEKPKVAGPQSGRVGLGTQLPGGSDIPVPRGPNQ